MFDGLQFLPARDKISGHIEVRSHQRDQLLSMSEELPTITKRKTRLIELPHMTGGPRKEEGDTQKCPQKLSRNGALPATFERLPKHSREPAKSASG